jgi:hypothetical protein
MNFTCKKCKQEISISSEDEELFKGKGWRCLECYTPIFNREYEMNIPGAEVFFSPIGEGLGDNIVKKVIQDYYLKDNPSETVHFANSIIDIYDFLKGRKKYKKVFWSDISIGLLEKPGECINYSIPSESKIMALHGIYPKWDSFEDPNIPLPKQYAVFHQRNINKSTFKNIQPVYAFQIEKLFVQMNFPVVILGNDMPVTGEANPLIIDLRKRLKVDEIAWVIRNAAFYVGVDSGISHLAGACSEIPMITFQHKNNDWFPRVDPKRIQSFHEKETEIGPILALIKNQIGGCRV